MYKAPEELQTGTRDQRTDVFSFACIVNFMTSYGTRSFWPDIHRFTMASHHSSRCDAHYLVRLAK
jgi:hypothetical protein